jgi:hypothetical protein
MMGPLLRCPMSRTPASAPRRGPGPWEGMGRWAGFGFGSALLLVGVSAGAQQVASPYPPASLFRTLQLTALACSRDNDTASCDKARSMADPLMDHQRLSATCKDTLFAIIKNAVPAPTNSLERRDRLDRPAKDVTIFCRQPVRPAASSESNPAAGSAQPGAPSGGGSLFSPPR